jgi:hypothetical protein
VLARTYEAQRIYVDNFNTLANNMYATLLNPDNPVVRIDGISQPIRLDGVVRDYALRGRQLVEAYRATLLTLGVDPETLGIEAAPPDGTAPAATEPAAAAP